jgi:hypothetical protein
MELERFPSVEDLFVRNIASSYFTSDAGTSPAATCTELVRFPSVEDVLCLKYRQSILRAIPDR